MKFFISINQDVIVSNSWHKESTLDTWALFDFLCFFNNADEHKTLTKDEKQYKWVNYKYLIRSIPICSMHNAKIKKHLDILEGFGLIKTIKDELNNVYFRLLPKHKILFEKSSSGSKDCNHPPVKIVTTPSQDLNHNNNKESIITNNQECIPLVSFANATETIPPKGEGEFKLKPEKSEAVSSKAKNEYTPEFESFWNIYRKKRSEGKAPAFKQWQKVIKKIKPDELIKILEAHIKEWDFKSVNPNFIPHAKTWLYQERYLDELDNSSKWGSDSIDYGEEESVF